MHPGLSVSYSVDFTINGSLTTVATGTVPIGASPSNFTGSSVLSVTPGDPVTDWEMAISLEFHSGGSTGELRFDVTTLEIQGEKLAAVREPSTFLLAMPIAGFVIDRARRRKRRLA